jgi:predicted transport protein
LPNKLFVDWLKQDFGLGHGYAMAIILTLKNATQPKTTNDESIAKHFSGGKARWRKPYDALLAKVMEFGPDVSVSPTDSYISMLRKGKKFAIVQVTSERMDIGIKLKGAKKDDRFEAAGAWNAMVTHRVRITDPRQVDANVLNWLEQAYESARSNNPRAFAG